MALAPNARSHCNLLEALSGLHLLQKDPNPLVMMVGWTSHPTKRLPLHKVFKDDMVQ